MQSTLQEGSHRLFVKTFASPSLPPLFLAKAIVTNTQSKVTSLNTWVVAMSTCNPLPRLPYMLVTVLNLLCGSFCDTTCNKTTGCHYYYMFLEHSWFSIVANCRGKILKISSMKKASVREFSYWLPTMYYFHILEIFRFIYFLF